MGIDQAPADCSKEAKQCDAHEPSHEVAHQAQGAPPWFVFLSSPNLTPLSTPIARDRRMSGKMPGRSVARSARASAMRARGSSTRTCRDKRDEKDDPTERDHDQSSCADT